MPFPNEHACRVREPSEFKKGGFRRIKLSTGLDAIIGRLKGKTSTTTQALRYAKTKWTVERARNHCKKEKGRFEAASKSVSSMKDIVKNVLKEFVK